MTPLIPPNSAVASATAGERQKERRKSHFLKCWPEFFEAIRNGSKTFEVRKNDRGFRIGDELELDEFIPQDGTFTGRSLTRRVTYILEGSGTVGTQFGVQSGYVVMGLASVSAAPEQEQQTSGEEKDEFEYLCADNEWRPCRILPWAKERYITIETNGVKCLVPQQNIRPTKTDSGEGGAPIASKAGNLATQNAIPAWQPIETAPKDGRMIDLWARGRRWADCYWGKPDHSCGEAGVYCDSDWHGAKPGWVDGACPEFLYERPTHWMPIPNAPSVESGTENQPVDQGSKAGDFGKKEPVSDNVNAVLQKALALVSFQPTGCDDGPECARCYRAVAVKDGMEWEDGDVCYECAVAIVDEVKLLLSEHAPKSDGGSGFPETFARDLREIVRTMPKDWFFEHNRRASHALSNVIDLLAAPSDRNARQCSLCGSEEHETEKCHSYCPTPQEVVRNARKATERDTDLERAEAGDRFKAFVHNYLTQHGVPEGDPTNQHQIEGCRIGARLDILFAQLAAMKEALTKIAEKTEATETPGAWGMEHHRNENERDIRALATAEIDAAMGYDASEKPLCRACNGTGRVYINCLIHSLGTKPCPSCSDASEFSQTKEGSSEET